jgi:hypothetical protein
MLPGTTTRPSAWPRSARQHGYSWRLRRSSSHVWGSCSQAARHLRCRAAAPCSWHGRYARRATGHGRYARRSTGHGRYARRATGHGRYARCTTGHGRYARRSTGHGRTTRRATGHGRTTRCRSSCASGHDASGRRRNAGHESPDADDDAADAVYSIPGTCPARALVFLRPCSSMMAHFCFGGNKTNYACVRLGCPHTAGNVKRCRESLNALLAALYALTGVQTRKLRIIYTNESAF